MIQNYSTWRVLRVFFDDPLPEEGFTERWISRQAGLSLPSVRLHLKKLCDEGKEGFPLVKKYPGISYPVYRANRDNELFRFYKKMDMLFRLKECGLAEFLWEECSPHVVVLFGSASRGEDIKGSDADIFVAGKEKELDLKRFEDALKRKINLHFCRDINRLPKELRNNIINGIVLMGYLKVF